MACNPEVIRDAKLTLKKLTPKNTKKTVILVCTVLVIAITGFDFILISMGVDIVISTF